MKKFYYMIYLIMVLTGVSPLLCYLEIDCIHTFIDRCQEYTVLGVALSILAFLYTVFVGWMGLYLAAKIKEKIK